MTGKFSFQRAVFVMMCISACFVWAAEPATKPATQAAQDDGISDRQLSLLLQLANAEANIKTINQALVRTGYKVGVEYDRLERTEKGNELMDRNGGGPVPWDQDYGKTARASLAPAPGGRTSVKIYPGGVDPWNDPLHRSPQFDFIYRANNQQIAKAREQIKQLAQDQAALLARRQKHEADQSGVWAMLSWEQVQDREILVRPLYRFKLKGANAANAELLRAPILFLRMVDKAVADGLEALDKDQPGTLAALNQRTKAAYAALQESMATALLAPGLKPDDRKEADAIKAISKQVTEECVIIDENYRKALDSDRAEGRRLEA